MCSRVSQALPLGFGLSPLLPTLLRAVVPLTGLCCVMLAAWPVAAQCGNKTSDSVFLGVTKSSSFPQIVEFDISRVVSSDTDSNGFLLNPAQDVQNGLVSDQAYLSYGGLFEINGFAAGNVISFYVNGVQVAQRPVIEGPAADCITIPISNIKFAQRVAGQAPTPGANVLTVKYDGLDVPDQFVELGNLSFKAMAPIIMVHGWNSGPWVWGPAPADPGICTANPEKLTDGGHNFVQRLIDTRVPFDCSIAIKPHSSNILGGGQLGTQLLAILNGFGTRHVNLVAHSKGGLWTRTFL